MSYYFQYPSSAVSDLPFGLSVENTHKSPNSLSVHILHTITSIVIAKPGSPPHFQHLVYLFLLARLISHQ